MRRLVLLVMVVTTAACAGAQKSCAKDWAGTAGANWMVVQYNANGLPFNCWKLPGAVVEHTEGGNLDWQDRATGHLVHVTGWENSVQVSGTNYASAAALLGVDEKFCGNGAYPNPAMLSPGRIGGGR